MADWPVVHPCERCGTRVQYRVWVSCENIALCGHCWLEKYTRSRKMADEKDCKHEQCEVSMDNLHLYCCECGKDMSETEDE